MNAFLPLAALAFVIAAGVMHYMQVDTLHQIIAIQKRQLEICQAQKVSTPEGAKR